MVLRLKYVDKYVDSTMNTDCAPQNLKFHDAENGFAFLEIKCNKTIIIVYL